MATDAVMRSKNWGALEEMLEDLKATAEVESNPRLAQALLEEEDQSKYVEIKD